MEYKVPTLQIVAAPYPAIFFIANLQFSLHRSSQVSSDRESMGLMAPATLFRSRFHPSSHLQLVSGLCKLAPDKKMSIIQHVHFQRSDKYQLVEHKNRRILSPPSATSSGFEASMVDAEDSKLRFKTVDIVVESNEASEIQVPKGLLLNMIGEERVTKFTIQEIVTSVLFDYVKKENLAVKDNKISTTQTEAELKLSFSPGNAFGFNAVLEIEET